MILLDSSVLIELFRKKNKRQTLFYKLSQSEDDFSISTITYYEIGIGNRKSHQNYWDLICEKLTIFPFDKRCAENAIKIYSDLKRKNQLIDLADLFIGSTAKTHNISIATLNVKHFKRIKGLILHKH